MSERPNAHESIIHMLADSAARAPGREAILCGEKRLSYRQFVNCVAGLADDLRGRGAGKGERIALVLGNSTDFCIASFAAQAAGAQVVPLNPVYTARELSEIIQDAEPLALIYDPASHSPAGEVAGDLNIPHCIRVGDDVRPDSWRDEKRDLPEPFPAPSDLATLQYTGGTTGRAKGVNLTHRAMATNLAQKQERVALRPDEERLCAVTPLFHVYSGTMMYMALYNRGTFLTMPKFEPGTALDLIERERVTVFCGIPTVYTALMGHEGFETTDFSSLSICFSGASSLSVELMKKWEAITGVRILEGFGQSEAGPVISFNPRHGVAKPGSVGPALVETEIQIVDVETGNEILPAGEAGEIRLRGPQIMSGYRNRPEETAEALRDGWLYTGDIGALDEDGYLFIRDRKKEMVIVSGNNVFPREIEEVLYGLDGVAETACVGAPHDYKGEIVIAYVVPERGATLTKDSLRDHCQKNLAKYKVPAIFRIVEELPKTPVGKIDKKTLRAKAADDVRKETV